MKKNILIVDDEIEIADLLEIYLINENYAVFKHYNSKEAMDCINKQKIDLVILDVMLPDGDGFSMCQRLRGSYYFPIIMLTAKNEERDKIKGLIFGADDYITKPFKPLEVVARVKAQLRRHTKYNIDSHREENELSYRGLTIDVNKHKCILRGTSLPLTPTEFQIMSILCQEKGNVVSSEKLFHKIWGDEYFDKKNNTIATHVRHLREKMGDFGQQYIKTVWGVGYKLEE